MLLPRPGTELTLSRRGDSFLIQEAPALIITRLSGRREWILAPAGKEQDEPGGENAHVRGRMIFERHQKAFQVAYPSRAACLTAAQALVDSQPEPVL